MDDAADDEDGDDVIIAPFAPKFSGMSPFAPAVLAKPVKALTFLERIQEASKELRSWEITSNEAKAVTTLNSVKTLSSQEPQQATAAYTLPKYVAGGHPQNQPKFGGFGSFYSMKPTLQGTYSG